MKKLMNRLTPYLAGIYFPLLFAVQAVPEMAVWRRMALWIGIHLLLCLVLEAAGRRAGIPRALVGAGELWLALFAQVFLRGLLEPAAIDLSERTRAGFLFLFVIICFLLILDACFGGKKPAPRGRNVLGLTALMMVMPAVLLIVGVFNRIFFFIGLGWGLLTLLIMLLRVLTDRNAPKPAAEEEILPPEDRPKSALATIAKWLSWLAAAGVLVLMVLAARQVDRTPYPASDTEIARYMAYQMDIEAVKKAAGTNDPGAAILAFCEFEKQETIGETVWRFWKPKGIEAFLPEAEKIGEIAEPEGEDVVHLYYDARDGKQVYLNFGTAEGKEFGYVTVYDPKTDVAFSPINDVYYIWRRFRDSRGGIALW